MDHAKVLDAEDLTPGYLQALEEKIKALGVSPSEEFLHATVQYLGPILVPSLLIALNCAKLIYTILLHSKLLRFLYFLMS